MYLLGIVRSRIHTAPIDTNQHHHHYHHRPAPSQHHSTMPTTRSSGRKTRSKTKMKASPPQPATEGTRKRATSPIDKDRVVKKQRKTAKKDVEGGDEGKIGRKQSRGGPKR